MSQRRHWSEQLSTTAKMPRHYHFSLAAALSMGTAIAQAESPLPTCFAAYQNRAELLLQASQHHHHHLPIPKHIKRMTVIRENDSDTSTHQFLYGPQGRLNQINYTFQLKEPRPDAHVPYTSDIPREVNIRRGPSGISVQIHRESRFATFKPLVINEKQQTASLDEAHGYHWHWSWNDEKCEVSLVIKSPAMSIQRTSSFNRHGQVTQERFVFPSSFDHGENTPQLTIAFDPKTGRRRAYLLIDKTTLVTGTYNQRGDWVSLTDDMQGIDNYKPMRRTLDYYQ